MPLQSGILRFDNSAADPVMSAWTDGIWIGNADCGVSRSSPGLAASLDGRIDNREDLLLALSFENGCSDSALLLGAFERWGIAGFGRIIGDWGAVVWDPRCRTLHLARDYMGARPLYYCLDPSYVAWSTSLGDLVRTTHRDGCLSDLFAAQFMSLRVLAEVTPFDDVRGVMPGTCVSIAAGRVTQSRFWSLEPGEIRYRDPRAYEDHLRSLWRDALRARLRTTDVAWAELSGGLDSSSVVCMADRLLRQGVVGARGLRLVSHATLESPEGDERRFIAEVERQVGVTSVIVGVEAHQEVADPDWSWVTPHAAQGVGLESVNRVRSAGGRIILSGRLGDAIMGCQPDNSVAVFDDLRRAAVWDALRNLREWSRTTRKPFIEIAWRLFSAERLPRSGSGAELLTPRLRQMVLDRPPIAPPLQVRRAKRQLARMVWSYSAGARLDVPSHPPGIVYTHPFTHRPLVDFMLAIPGDQLSAPGVTRSLMRRSFEHLVPARVLCRVSKGYYPPAAFRAARRIAASMLPVDALEVVQRGWIDGSSLTRALRTLTDGGGATGGDIHCVLRLERWLQARRQRSATPQRKEVNSHAVLHA